MLYPDTPLYELLSLYIIPIAASAWLAIAKPRWLGVSVYISLAGCLICTAIFMPEIVQSFLSRHSVPEELRSSLPHVSWIVFHLPRQLTTSLMFPAFALVLRWYVLLIKPKIKRGSVL